MKTIFLIKYLDWDNRVKNLSFHRTKEGAEKAYEKAREYYEGMAWMYEENVKD